MNGIEAKVRLSTLLGLDRKPGELAGFGPMHAEFITDLARGLGEAQWRWVLLTTSGTLLRTGLTPARPRGTRLREAACTSTVDLHIPTHLLDTLANGDTYRPPLGIDPTLWAIWRPVLVDIANRAKKPEPPQNPHLRFVGRPRRRKVQIKATHCIGVGCRTPASTADLDHHTDHAKGGKSTEANNGPECRHHHRVKHEAGWKLDQVPNGYLWTTRLGHTYFVPTPKISPDLPDPITEPPPGPLLIDEPDPDPDSLGRPWQYSTTVPDHPDVPPF